MLFGGMVRAHGNTGAGKDGLPFQNRPLKGARRVRADSIALLECGDSSPLLELRIDVAMDRIPDTN